MKYTKLIANKANKIVGSFPQYITTGNHDDTPLSPIGKGTPEEWLLEAISTIPEGSL